MAIWQFQFSLIPTAGILKAHGGLIATLPEYATRDPDSPVKELSEFNNYWTDIELASPLVGLLEQLLPPKKSWSKDAKMFGCDEKNNIEIWGDDINCAVDVRDLDISLLSSIIEIAKNMQCKIVLKDGGRVIDPDIPKVMDALNNSLSMKFVLDPVRYMQSREDSMGSTSD